MENLCGNCDLCCRKYKIYLFPTEAKKIARFFKINYKEFVAKYLDYYFEFFKLEVGQQIDEFPVIIIDKERYAFLPILAIKKNNNACVFLENHSCSIYNVRPLICRLFPDFKIAGEKYDFCKLDKDIRTTEKEREKYYPILKRYLNDLRQKGFKNTWHFLPTFKKENIFLKPFEKNDLLLEKIKNFLIS